MSSETWSSGLDSRRERLLRVRIARSKIFFSRTQISTFFARFSLQIIDQPSFSSDVMLGQSLKAYLTSALCKLISNVLVIIFLISGLLFGMLFAPSPGVSSKRISKPINAAWKLRSSIVCVFFRCDILLLSPRCGVANGKIDSRFVRYVWEVSSHQVARGVLHLLQTVLSFRISGRGLPHSMQYIVNKCCSYLVNLERKLFICVLRFGFPCLLILYSAAIVA